jgi:predicted transcriptional regulator
MNQSEQASVDFIGITADIVSSYVAKNVVHHADLAAVIASVHTALQGLVAPKLVEPEKPQPPVSIRKSVTPDFLISLEDGKPYKALKRHLTRLGLTPEAYREKWGLPLDYPMVAPNYAQKRSELAKSFGLGERRRKSAAAKRQHRQRRRKSPRQSSPQRRSAVPSPRTKQRSRCNHLILEVEMFTARILRTGLAA